ncbi:hypothetical protein [Mycolicibacterium mageritense]|uniref:hypothetical protein n=1 Tax=Mycolicibacterium mageritense TaxID=53462 RepID=UPI001E611E72|nr:hypothetical protein [Mycolicibacterium mageritense]GJJ21974.1 hypothetical protein MTY414_56470 [Mycolicibacterium mageritense]
MVETYGIELAHRASVTILADIEYAPAITWPGFAWLLVFPATVFVAGLVIYTFNVAVVAAFGDVADDRKSLLEVIGLIAIGIVLAWVFYYMLRWVLGHTESGWGALGLVFLVVLVASLLVMGYAWLTDNSNYYFTVIGIVVVAVISWTVFQHDWDTRPAMDEPHRAEVVRTTR